MRLIPAIVAVALVGCNTDKIAQLETQNKELQAQLASRDLEMQAKCSKAANDFIIDHWPGDKKKYNLSYSNHYSRKRNRCFAVIQTMVDQPDGAVQTTVEVFDVYEGVYQELPRYSYHVPADPRTKERQYDKPILICLVDGKTCKDQDAFMVAIKPYTEE